ncbi:hypothetical protein GGX14DRAFT_395414 [Mycena pura]|uniref:Uncharacterized protein n=1 Tax=Mycena pura TaxID=153505 RepID=A0AAD6YER9_9AGAR|nr:hypothetical protein GGX14DRAFT_395414 [Mycena pura]
MWRVVHQFTHWCTLPSASVADPFGGGFTVWQDKADSRRANGQAPRSGRQVQQERRWADTSPRASVPVRAPGASPTTAGVPSVTPSRTARAICAGTGAISYGRGGGDDT